MSETPEQKTARLQAQIDEAATLLTSGKETDAQSAVRLLKESAEGLPDSALAQYNLGVAYHHLGQLDEAKVAFKKAVELDDQMAEAWINLAAIYVAQDELSRAMDTYRAGLRIHDEEMSLWSGLIGLLRKVGRLDDAVNEATAALKINANSLEVYNNLGLVYLDRGELEMAQFILQKALTTINGGDSNAQLHCNLGVVWLAQEKEVDARMEFEKALELDPELVPAMVFLSDYYLQNRNYSDTVSLLERAAGLDPENPTVQLNLGVGYRGMERYEDDYLELSPDDPDPYLNLGILYGDYVKAYDEAIDAYTKYKDHGGDAVALADEYIDQTRKEQERVKKLEDRKQRLEEERKKREEQKKLLEEAKKKEEEAAKKAAQEEAKKAEDEAQKAAEDAVEQAMEEKTGGDEAGDKAGGNEDAGGDEDAGGEEAGGDEDAGGEEAGGDEDAGGNEDAGGEEAGGDAPEGDAPNDDNPWGN